jgi:hypothetical protein
MIYLQSFNSQYYLFHLIRLGFSFMILNIYPGIALPWGFVDSMTGPTLTRLTKKVIAYLAQIAKSNAAWILLHLCKYVIYSSHVNYGIIIGIIVKSCFFNISEIDIQFLPHNAAFQRARFFALRCKSLVM